MPPFVFILDMPRFALPHANTEATADTNGGTDDRGGVKIRTPCFPPRP